MSDILLLKGYNNYFNRIVRSERDADGYIAASAGHAIERTINFNPGDGINAELVIGRGAFVATHDFDYLIELKDGEIATKWFILQSDRTREGQYRLTLKRDLIAENLSAILSAPCYVEKGHISDINNPLLYNKESLQVNQIKRYERPIKDETKCAWVVGYIARDAFETPTAGKNTKTVTTPSAILSRDPDFEVDTWSQFQYNDYFVKKVTTDNTVGLTVRVKERALHEDDQANELYKLGTWTFRFKDIWNSSRAEIDDSFTAYRDYAEVPTTPWPPTTPGSAIDWNNSSGEMYSAPKSTVFPQMPQSMTASYRTAIAHGINTSGLGAILKSQLTHGDLVVDSSVYNQLMALDGKWIKVNYVASTYEIHVARESLANSLNEYSPDVINPVNAAFASMASVGFSGALSGGSVGDIKVDTGGGQYIHLTATKVDTQSKAELPIAENRQHLFDAPYDMLCMPYGDNISVRTATDGTISCDKEVAISMMTSIGAELGADAIYDVQLLPYCPIRDLIAVSPNPDQVLDARGFQTIPVTTDSSGAEVYNQVIIMGLRSTFSFTIPNDDALDVDLSTPEMAKFSNDCMVHRLVSGKHDSIFEFSPAKSHGFDYYRIDCTYKPFQPYIHIIPELKFLYGDDFAAIDDARGLICAGDYSLTQLSNAWSTYKLNNVTYQESFDRDIKHMDVAQDLERRNQAWNTGFGVIRGTMSGAMSGAMMGGGYGAAAGAIIGGIASGVGASFDYRYMNIRQKEEKDYAIDKFNYSLRNIQAIPSAISKVSPLVANTRLWPYAEVYSCTDEEKEIYLKKLRWDGMTVNAIGTLGDYCGNGDFVKGELIRLEGINEDGHVLYEIYNEILKGVYI